MNKKIFSGIFSASVVILILSLILIMGVLYDYFSAQTENQMSYEAQYVGHGLEMYGMDYVKALKSHDLDDNRITWIAQDGTVLYDSSADAGTMENHADRKEIKEALENGTGESSRYSITLAEQTSYYALRLDDGTVVRICASQNTIFTLIVGVIQPLTAIILIAVLISIYMAYRISKKVLEPINCIDLDNPEDSDVYDELAPLLKRIANQNLQIQFQMEELKHQQYEFRTITENMTEGFIVIDDRTEILSYNSSALRILHVDEPEPRQSILTMNRDASLRDIVDNGLAGKHCERLWNYESRIYSLIANPVFDENDHQKVNGVVIAMIDATEKESRNELRREFTANVSHELKTPLTSILGFAEIMKTGIVKPADMFHFSENIYNEAQRLLSLIGDILRLSMLEENKRLPERHVVNLGAAATDVVERLRPIAEKNNIELKIDAEPADIEVMPQVLDEVIFNIAENAIKYNREGGSVEIITGYEGEKPVIRVKDTGIGISKDEQQRVFERFYRVDKAHSREIGGTGLGLSIVKHGVNVMGAEIRMKSELDVGTEITVYFRPKTQEKPTEIV